jgi:aminotransferase
MAGGIAAQDGPQACVGEMVAAYAERRAMVVARLNAAGLRCPAPEGAFYVFPMVPGDDVAFAQELLEAEGVAVVPGSAFGGPGHVRMTLAASAAHLERAMDGIARFMARR